MDTPITDRQVAYLSDLREGETRPTSEDVNYVIDFLTDLLSTPRGCRTACRSMLDLHSKLHLRGQNLQQILAEGANVLPGEYAADYLAAFDKSMNSEIGKMTKREASVAISTLERTAFSIRRSVEAAGSLSDIAISEMVRSTVCADFGKWLYPRLIPA